MILSQAFKRSASLLFRAEGPGQNRRSNPRRGRARASGGLHSADTSRNSNPVRCSRHRWALAVLPVRATPKPCPTCP